MNQNTYKVILFYEDMNGMSGSDKYYRSVWDVKTEIEEMKKSGLILFCFETENKDWSRELEQFTGIYHDIP